MLDDLTPAGCVVGGESDLAFHRRDRGRIHSGRFQVEVEQIPEPHRRANHEPPFRVGVVAGGPVLTVASEPWAEVREQLREIAAREASRRSSRIEVAGYR